MNEGNVLIKRNKELQTAHKEASFSHFYLFIFMLIQKQKKKVNCAGEIKTPKLADRLSHLNEIIQQFRLTICKCVWEHMSE